VEGEKDGVLTGRNRGNKLVHFRCQQSIISNQRPGTSNQQSAISNQGPALVALVDVRITKSTPWSLQGEMVETANHVIVA